MRGEERKKRASCHNYGGRRKKEANGGKWRAWAVSAAGRIGPKGWAVSASPHSCFPRERKRKLRERENIHIESARGMIFMSVFLSLSLSLSLFHGLIWCDKGEERELPIGGPAAGKYLFLSCGEIQDVCSRRRRRRLLGRPRELLFNVLCESPEEEAERERERDTPPIERMHTTRQSVSTYVSVTKREREIYISVANSLLLVFLSALTPQWDRKKDIVHTKD